MQGLSMVDAAEAVLRGHSKGAPMHYRRITELAISDGLITPGGATPEASLNAAVSQEIKRRLAAGKEPRFRAHGRGLYGLAVPVDPLGGAIDRKNHDVRRQLRKVLAEIDPRAFEGLIGELLTSLGFEEVEVTRYSNDGGIDLRARLAVGGVTDVRTAIQVKRWSASVSPRIVRELRGGLGPHERGLVITLSTFTKEAKAEAAATDRSPISLVDGERLIDLLIDNEIGVTPKTVTILELDEASLSPLDDTSPEEIQDDSGADIAEPRPAVRRAVPRTGKSLTVWPLPGGRRSWKVALDRMLRFVADTAPTMTQAIGWMKTAYPKVTSDKVARSYWQVARSFGLLDTQGEHLALTAPGAGYLDDPTETHLLDVLCEEVAGITELLAMLEARPMTSVEALEPLNEALGVTWETDAQIRFRLGWLENLGTAAQTAGIWKYLGPPSGAPT
jgi:hypothetical protein